MYSFAMVASGNLGANESGWNVVCGLICAAARVTSSSVVAPETLPPSVASWVQDSDGSEAGVEGRTASSEKNPDAM